MGRIQLRGREIENLKVKVINIDAIILVGQEWQDPEHRAEDLLWDRKASSSLTVTEGKADQMDSVVDRFVWLTTGKCTNVMASIFCTKRQRHCWERQSGIGEVTRVLTYKW